MQHPFSLQHIKKDQSEICIYNETIMMLTIHEKKKNIYVTKFKKFVLMYIYIFR